MGLTGHSRGRQRRRRRRAHAEYRRHRRTAAPGSRGRNRTAAVLFGPRRAGDRLVEELQGKVHVKTSVADGTAPVASGCGCVTCLRTRPHSSAEVYTNVGWANGYRLAPCKDDADAFGRLVRVHDLFPAVVDADLPDRHAGSGVDRSERLEEGRSPEPLWLRAILHRLSRLLEPQCMRGEALPKMADEWAKARPSGPAGWADLRHCSARLINHVEPRQCETRRFSEEEGRQASIPPVQPKKGLSHAHWHHLA